METTNENAIMNGNAPAIENGTGGQVTQRANNFILLDFNEITEVYIRKLITEKKKGGLNHYRVVVKTKENRMLPVYGSILKEALYQLDIDTVRNDIMTGVIPVFIIS